MVMVTYQKLKSKMPFSALVKPFQPKRQTKCLRYLTNFSFSLLLFFLKKKEKKNAASTVIFRETVIALVSKVFRTYYILPCPIFSLKIP